MIRVTLAEEPATFDRTVRKPGLSAIAELVGEKPTIRRPGPRRHKRANTREEIPASAFPEFWTKAIPDLLEKYHRLCAFLACYMEEINPATVDHMIPKSRAWHLVYEWSNYRLASHLLNSLKSDLIEFIDPFEIQDDWFGLELVEFEVYIRQSFPTNLQAAAKNTLDCLNQRDCCVLRKQYVIDYHNREIALNYLERRAPFVARELRRQRRLNAGDI